MARDREIICEYYTYAGGPCNKRSIPVHFCKECQTCNKYQPIKNGRPARPDTRRKKLDRAKRRDEGC